MVRLPIDEHLPRIVAAAKDSRALVLVAEPGAGKTTRVPPALLAAQILWRDHPNLVMLQPRRVAAHAAAERIAAEQGWQVGREVGYHVRFDRRIGGGTRLRVLTEGILTRQLLDDPCLEGVGAVLLDEFHERSLNTDLAVAMLREVRQTVRPDLIVLVMSATLEAEPVARFLGGCPIIRVEGRMFPVEIEHLASAVVPRRDTLADAVAVALERQLSDGAGGDVLVFLPGADEIRRTQTRLQTIAAERDLLVLPLYGSLSPQEQALALRPADRRRVILATNIAETSLTIDGVRLVIDSGLARVAGYDPRRGLDRLELKRISRASATQRAGRAGRTAPGRCVRLWSMAEDRALAPFELPEIRRVDLCSTVLAMHAWGKSDVRSFEWFDPPAEEALAAAERLLAMLGALDRESKGQITSLGKRLLSLPLHPRLGRLMLQAADSGLLAEGATLAALMEEKDILSSGAGAATVASSDLLHRADLLGAGGRDFSIDPAAARQVARSREALLRIGQSMKPRSASGPANRAASMLQFILLAYPDRVARRRNPGASTAVMVGGAGIKLAPESVVRNAEFFVAIDARDDERSANREALVRVASAIEVEWLELFFPQSIRQERLVVYDPRRDRVVGHGRTLYRDLLLREDQDAAVDAEQAGAVLAEALGARAAEIFSADDASAQWLARLSLLRQHMPEHPWPAGDDRQLRDVLSRACAGKRSLDEVSRLPLASFLEQLLAYPLDRLMQEQAPPSLEVPSGSRIRLEYKSGARPVLAVRLQEIFGWTDTPRVAAGRVPVLVHLLGPNYRPVQVTDDLRSFWSSAYFHVRKDLRMRYPKHAWPDDPLTATPQARGRPRGSGGR